MNDASRSPPGGRVLRLGALRAYYVLTFAALGVYLPMFPRWLEARGMSSYALGAASALMPAMGLVAPPLWGALADAAGFRGAILRVACLGAGCAFAAIGAVVWLGASAGAPLFALVALFSFFRAPVTLIADTLALEHAAALRTSYSRIRLWGSAGFLVAALVAGQTLDASAAVPLPFVMAGALIAAGIAAWALPSRWERHRAFASRDAFTLVSSPSFLVFLATAFLSQAAHSSYDLVFSLHMRDLGASGLEIGVLWSIGVLAEIALMRGVSGLLETAPAWQLLALAFSGATLRWSLVAVLRSPLAVALAQPLHAFSFGLMWVASLAHVKRESPETTLATAQGLFTAAIAAGGIVAMPIWGALYSERGGGAVFARAAAISALAAVAAVALGRVQRPHDAAGRKQ